MSIAYMQVYKSDKHLPSRFPARCLHVLKGYRHRDYWELLSLVRPEYLELYILIL
jgi:hypothetical protein